MKNNKLTISDIREAVKQLKIANKPTPKSIELSKEELQNLKTDPAWVGITNYGSSVKLSQGEVGRVYGVPVFRYDQDEVSEALYDGE